MKRAALFSIGELECKTLSEVYIMYADHAGFRIKRILEKCKLAAVGKLVYHTGLNYKYNNIIVHNAYNMDNEVSSI